MDEDLWLTISDDRYEGCNIRTRGMTVPGGMIVQTIVTTNRLEQALAVSSVFVPHSRTTDCYGWLESFRTLSGNTH